MEEELLDGMSENCCCNSMEVEICYADSRWRNMAPGAKDIHKLVLQAAYHLNISFLNDI